MDIQKQNKKVFILLFLCTQLFGDIYNPRYIDNLWKNPTFQNEFTGSYSVLSEFQPSFRDDERSNLSEVSKILDDLSANTEDDYEEERKNSKIRNSKIN